MPPLLFQVSPTALGNLATSEPDALLANRLRLILTASEALPSDTVHKWLPLGHAAQLINMLGQTETTGIVATYPVRKAPGSASAVMPLGRPFDNTSIYALDEALQPVPAGRLGRVSRGAPSGRSRC